jgi:hypothetical protein
MVDAAEVEKRTDLIKARGVEIGTTVGGLKIMSGKDLEDMSVRIARGGIAVPVHCRDQAGVVHALMLQALEWGMPFMSVINKSYVPRGGDRIGYESQLLHAVVEKNARLKKRMRYEIGKHVDGKWIVGGEGDDIKCRVWATFEGEDEPHEYFSQTLAKMHPGHVTKDGVKYVKGSQMWDDDPAVQMFYAASRQWARLYCPDVLLGAYTPEEIQRGTEIKDVTPVASKIEAFAQRLRDKSAEHVNDRGFDAASVHTIIEGDINSDVANMETLHDNVEGRGVEHDAEGRRDGSTGGAMHPDDQGGSADAVQGTAQDGTPDAGARAHEGKDEGEIFPPDRKQAAKPKSRKR